MGILEDIVQFIEDNQESFVEWVKSNDVTNDETAQTILTETLQDLDEETNVNK